MAPGSDRFEESPSPPLLSGKRYGAPSVFTPESLLREARRQKGLASGAVPSICVFDPDGDLVDHLRAEGRLRLHPMWACYHTTLEIFEHEGLEYGLVGRVVGAPFAVLVAEELFACGCGLLVSITSAGQVADVGSPPYVVLIEKALRDEGTSYHYLPPSAYSHLDRRLREILTVGWDHAKIALRVGASWTTDAPFRETEAMIVACRGQGILAVEMEAAALYALAAARRFPITCFAHVTNRMGRNEGDFEKGAKRGAETSLRVIAQTARCWREREKSKR